MEVLSSLGDGGGPRRGAAVGADAPPGRRRGGVASSVVQWLGARFLTVFRLVRFQSDEGVVVGFDGAACPGCCVPWVLRASGAAYPGYVPMEPSVCGGGRHREAWVPAAAWIPVEAGASVGAGAAGDTSWGAVEWRRQWLKGGACDFCAQRCRFESGLAEAPGCVAEWLIASAC